MPSSRIGVVGCGNIAMTYMRNAALFGGVELTACADISPEMAALRAREYGIRALAVDALLGRSGGRSGAQPDDSRGAFRGDACPRSAAGKHVFTEKPLATSAEAGRRLVAEARARGLALGSAPDTFLGAAGRRARRLMDEGAIGRPVTGTAFMMGRGMEHWHPNPQFYYQPGGGPVLDMGPYYLTMLVNLLGPVARVMAMTSNGQRERLITAEGPLRGTTLRGRHADDGAVAARVPLRRDGRLRRLLGRVPAFQRTRSSCTGPRARCGCPTRTPSAAPCRSRPAAPTGRTSTATASSTAPATGPSPRPTAPTTACSASPSSPRRCGAGGAPRASGDLALHVLEVMEAILTSGETRGPVEVAGDVGQPPLLGEEEAGALLADPGRY